MNAVYLSGSGNTKHIVTLLLNELGTNGISVPVESEDVKNALEGFFAPISEEIWMPSNMSIKPRLSSYGMEKHAWPLVNR